MEFQLTDLIDGQYKVVEKHRGGMSIVYIVLDAFSQKRFAIKTVREELLEDRAAVDRFCEEAKTWMNIGRHQHVVEAIIYRDIGGQPFLWLEYVDGSDWHRVIEAEKRMHPVQVLNYALQVCDAMEYVHTAHVRGQRGVVHRDLKPANIMLDRRLGVKITDFGLAKVYGHSRHLADAGVGLGTYLYMPPEQVLDAASADACSDVFSFGASMYAALVGRAPVSGDTVGAVINSILSRVPPPPHELRPDVPVELSVIVSKCLAKQRADRYPDFTALRQDLTAAAPAVAAAMADREARKCQGCGHLTFHVYRACPICAGLFDVGPLKELMPPPGPQVPHAVVGRTAVSTQLATAPVAPTEERPRWDRAAVEALFAQAMAQRQEGRLRQAAAILRDLLALEPSHAKAREALDQIALELAREKSRTRTKAYNWTMFRGNIMRSGYTPEVIAPPLRRRWQTRVGEWIISSPAIVNGLVYIGAYVERPGRHGRLACLRAADGAITWSLDTSQEIVSSPVILDGHILYVGCHTSLLAVDCAYGRRLWEFTTQGEVIGSAAAWRNTVFFGSCDGRLYAIHPQSGQQMWMFRARGDICSSPAYWNGIVYIGSSDHRLYAINGDNGRVVWEFMTAGEILGAPAYAENRVYVGSTDNRIYCVDAPTGQKLWEYQTEDEVHGSPAVWEDTVYIGSRDHYIYALEARTGQVKWRFVTGDWVHSSPLVTGNVVYCGSHDRKLYAIEAETGVLLWEYETGGEVQSSPGASAGSIFVGSNDGYVYCFRP